MMFVSLHSKLVPNNTAWCTHLFQLGLPFWWAAFMNGPCVPVKSLSQETEWAVWLHVAAGVRCSIMPDSLHLCQLRGFPVKPPRRPFRGPIRHMPQSQIRLNQFMFAVEEESLCELLSIFFTLKRNHSYALIFPWFCQVKTANFNFIYWDFMWFVATNRL